ncbi:MAG: alkaline phosphatase [Muribaculaceae bacterium]
MTSRILTFITCLALSLSTFANTPKYIFFFIGDGMGMGHILSAETYNRTVLGNKEHLLMMQFPVTSAAITYSHNSPITDSAAAGTALSTGHKTDNGMLGMLPDSTNVTSIAAQLKKMGYGIAISTSVPPDDATPAAFYAHQPHRSMFYNIGKDMAASGYGFFAGSRLRGLKDKDGKATNLMKTLVDSGYTIVHGAKEMAKANNKNKIILLNEDSRASASQIGFTIDSIPGALTLPEITRYTINHLQRTSPKAFFAMIEGGNIDYAAHANDGATVIKEILNFNEAIAEAYNFYLKHPKETLIIITADHDTGGMSVGVEHGPKKVDMSDIDYQRVSKETFSNMCHKKLKEGTDVEWSEMKEYLTKNFGLYNVIPVSEKQDKDLMEEFDKTFKKHESKDKKTLYSSFNEFVEELFEILDRNTGFGWTTSSHTGNPVPVFAIGVGAEEFSKMSNNIEIPMRIRKIAKIKE